MVGAIRHGRSRRRGAVKTSEFIKLVVEDVESNYLVECPDSLGLNLLLPQAMKKVVSEEDFKMIAADQITKEKARQLEKEARMAPVGSSSKNHFFVFGLQKLPAGSAASLLKVVEESRYSRWIFQAQYIPRKIKTLKSRAKFVRLAFLSKRVVMGNMQIMNYDTRAVERQELYDGTLAGTIQALSMKDTIAVYKREATMGIRGLAALFSKDALDSPALDFMFRDKWTPQERAFISRGSADRKKLAIFLALTR